MANIKYYLLLYIISGSINSLYAQKIEGDWYGNLEGVQLNLVFHIHKDDKKYNATLDSPDQNSYGIPVDTVKFNDSKIEMIMTKLNAIYTASLVDGRLTGNFSQNGFKFPLILAQEQSKNQESKKSQEPFRPFPYLEEEVTFSNGNVTLSGTFTKPISKNQYPSVILINGSGPQDRDETILGHKPFLVLSDYLTRKGIAVLRYDDRGYGKSTGNFSDATSVDFASDVESAVDYLVTRDDIDKKHIGLIGHSEGGLIAPMVAAKNKDIDFIVLMAGTGIPGDSLLLMQQQMIGKSMGMTDAQLKASNKINRGAFRIINRNHNQPDIESNLRIYLKKTLDSIPEAELPTGISIDDSFIDTQVNLLTNPWMQYFLSYNPANTLKNVSCPVLAINGSKDLQVPAKENLSAIEHALQLGGNKNVIINEFAGLNHMFQESKTGSPTEYSSIEQTIAPVVLEEIYSWILKQLK